LPLVNLDREQVKRVVINLLDNAVAAMGEQGEVTLRTRYHPDLRIASLEVRDTGPGIPTENRKRIFEPYFTTKVSGTGLGLSIVRKIMEDHHGYIRVQSNSPTGAVFVLEFPVAEDRLQELA
jgi:two-component system nitrogen regulation sensor histidine kinase NtrY